MSSALAVVVATRGRPLLVRRLIELLRAQTRPADRIVIVGSDASDLGDIEPGPDLTCVVAPSGLVRQRNEGLRLVGDRFDVVVFFDDDFVPSRLWLERAERLLSADRNLAGLTGRILADGLRSAGIDSTRAEALVADADRRDAWPLALRPAEGLHGCNMAVRGAALQGLDFDENLPLHAWLEDADFSARLRYRGEIGMADGLRGVHLGVRTGRAPGRRLGYSQIANPVYLSRKGSVTWRLALRLISRDVAGNLLPTRGRGPWMDRRARLIGHAVALLDLLRGRLDPRRVQAI